MVGPHTFKERVHGHVVLTSDRHETHINAGECLGVVEVDPDCRHER